MREHLPAFLVTVPLILAPVCALMPRGRAAWTVSMGAVAWSFWMSIQILQQVLTEGTIRYALGGWAAPWGIEYRIDLVNAFLAVVVTSIGLVVTPYALRSAEREIDHSKLPLFYAAWTLSLTGLLGIAITGDVFNVFVFLEISSLSGYGMIALGRDRRALTAAYRYLIAGSVGATFIVIGIGMMYGMTGSLNMMDLAERIPDVADSRTIRVAFAFLFVGVGLKLALFPLHMWLPNAYAYAPSAVTSFIAATATKVAVYMLLRFFFTVFGPEFAFDTMQLDLLLIPLAMVAIFSMSLVAIYQRDVKRLLAYSSVAQLGYMVLGIGLVSVAGLTAAVVHLFNHALMKAALFMAVGCVVYRIGSVRLDDWGGIGKQMPWTMGAFVGAGLSIIGVPLTVGFVSKWYLIQGLLERNLWPIALLVLLTSVMALVYIWKVVEVAYFQAPPEDRKEPATEAPMMMLVPLWVLVVANFYFGIDASVTAGVARRAAQTLLGMGP